MLLILVQVVLEVAEVLHLPVRLVLLVIRVRPEPLLGAVVQDQLIVDVYKRKLSIPGIFYTQKLLLKLKTVSLLD